MKSITIGLRGCQRVRNRVRSVRRRNREEEADGRWMGRCLGVCHTIPVRDGCE